MIQQFCNSILSVFVLCTFILLLKWLRGVPLYSPNRKEFRMLFSTWQNVLQDKCCHIRQMLQPAADFAAPDRALHGRQSDMGDLF